MIDLVKKTKVRRLNISTNKRLIFISDIHGDLESLKEALKKINFSDEDYLFIIGDIYEKGDFRMNIATIRYVMELTKTHKNNTIKFVKNLNNFFRRKQNGTYTLRKNN